MVSCPGKVLIAGGYLILDPNQIGLVLALSARVYVHITLEKEEDGIITVTSPQFLNATWKYKCHNQDGDLHVENLYTTCPFHLLSAGRRNHRTITCDLPSHTSS